MMILIRLLRSLFLLTLSIALAPAFLALGILLVLANALARLGPSCQKDLTDHVPDKSSASIVILNWNGRELLRECLPSVEAAVKQDGGEHEIILVDNGSSDGSVDFVRENFPQVRIISLPFNLGFGQGNNIGVREARRDIVILLNNDMVVDRGFIRPLLDGFDKDVFAVASQIFFQDRARRREETGKTSAHLRRGWIVCEHEPVLEGCRKLLPVLWAGGGSSAFDRRKFLELGGFDPLYSPAYVEDLDLSFRAWRRGWKVLFSPESIVYHKHRASSNRRFGATFVDVLTRRNQFLFLWKNIAQTGLILSHVLFLPLTLFHLMRSGGIVFILAFLGALARLPMALMGKFKSKGLRSKISDGEIFDLTRNRHKYFQAQAQTRISVTSRPLNILMVTAYLPHLGVHAGAGRMFQLIRHLSARHRIWLLTFLEAEDERAHLPEVEKYCVMTRALLRPKRISRSLFPYEPFDEFDCPEMRVQLSLLLEANDYDILQLEYAQMGAYVPDTRAKVVLTEHEVNFLAHYKRMEHASAPHAKLKRFYDYMHVMYRELDICRKVDKIICVSSKDAEDLTGYVRPEKIAVVPMGVDLDHFKPDHTVEEPNSLVFVGAFQHYPNVDAMVYFCQRILPLIRAQVPEAKLYIVGSKPTAEVLRLGRQDNVVCTGQVPDIRPYLARASVFVVPVRLGVGMRGKILEAWAMEKPVVATSLACRGIDARDGENVLIADDPRAFAERVAYLLGNGEARRRIAACGRRTALRYDWRTIAEMQERIYYELLS